MMMETMVMMIMIINVVIDGHMVITASREHVHDGGDGNLW